MVVDELAMAVFKACFAVRGAFGGCGEETSRLYYYDYVVR